MFCTLQFWKLCQVCTKFWGASLCFSEQRLEWASTDVDWCHQWWIERDQYSGADTVSDRQWTQVRYPDTFVSGPSFWRGVTQIRDKSSICSQCLCFHVSSMSSELSEAWFSGVLKWEVLRFGWGSASPCAQTTITGMTAVFWSTCMLITHMSRNTLKGHLLHRNPLDDYVPWCFNIAPAVCFSLSNCNQKNKFQQQTAVENKIRFCCSWIWADRQAIN